MDSVIRNDLDVRQSFVVAVIDVVVSYFLFFLPICKSLPATSLSHISGFPLIRATAIICPFLTSAASLVVLSVFCCGPPETES